MTTRISDVIEHLGAIRIQDLDFELRTLMAIRAWALRQLGIDYGPGDTVRIVRAPDTTGSAWEVYREALAVGQRGVVQHIDFNAYRDRWFADVILEREWTVPPIGQTGKIHWHGPVDQTPSGMEPPSKFDQENHPQGTKHRFMLWAEDLALATDLAEERTSSGSVN